MKKKKWFTETRRVDIATGEILSMSRIEREDYIQVGSEYSRTEDCGGYFLKIIHKTYKLNPQLKLEL